MSQTHQEQSAQEVEPAGPELVPAAKGGPQAQQGNVWASQSAGIPSAASLLPATRAEALAQHAEGVRRVGQVYRSALAQEVSPNENAASRIVLLRNSAEWIESGRVQLSSLAPTHDSAQRAPAGKIAYFDDRRAWDQGGATYNGQDPADMAGIRVALADEAAHMDGSKLVFFDAADMDQGDIADTFIHEIQHYCDGGPGDAFAPGAPPRASRYQAPAWVYHHYQSEYRARVMDPITRRRFGDPAQPASQKLTLTATRDATHRAVIDGTLPLTETIQTAFWNEQQLGVFSDMIRDPSPTRWYDYQAKEWLAIYAYFAHYFALDPDFREMVESFGEEGPHGSPLAGGNLVNSVRIDALAGLIQAGATDDEIRASAAELDAVDRAFLRDAVQSEPFWDAARAGLSSRRELFRELRSFILSSDPGQALPYAWYTVVAGDSLSLIAERMLGDMGRWAEIYGLNQAVIGPDPDRIEIGQKLRIPQR